MFRDEKMIYQEEMEKKKDWRTQQKELYIYNSYVHKIACLLVPYLVVPLSFYDFFKGQGDRPCPPSPDPQLHTQYLHTLIHSVEIRSTFIKKSPLMPVYTKASCFQFIKKVHMFVEVQVFKTPY